MSEADNLFKLESLIPYGVEQYIIDSLKSVGLKNINELLVDHQEVEKLFCEAQIPKVLYQFIIIAAKDRHEQVMEEIAKNKRPTERGVRPLITTGSNKSISIPLNHQDTELLNRGFITIYDLFNLDPSTLLSLDRLKTQLSESIDKLAKDGEISLPIDFNSKDSQGDILAGHSQINHTCSIILVSTSSQDKESIIQSRKKIINRSALALAFDELEMMKVCELKDQAEFCKDKYKLKGEAVEILIGKLSIQVFLAKTSIAKGRSRALYPNLDLMENTIQTFVEFFMKVGPFLKNEQVVEALCENCYLI